MKPHEIRALYIQVISREGNYLEAAETLFHLALKGADND